MDVQWRQAQIDDDYECETIACSRGRKEEEDIVYIYIYFVVIYVPYPETDPKLLPIIKYPL